MEKAALPQALKRLDGYLRKHGWMITAPYDGIKFMHQSATLCVLCGNIIEGQIFIPSLTDVDSGVLTAGAVCANLAQCEQRRKDREAQEKATIESRLKVIEEQIVFPSGEGQ
jgi:hypothetical protein